MNKCQKVSLKGFFNGFLMSLSGTRGSWKERKSSFSVLHPSTSTFYFFNSRFLLLDAENLAFQNVLFLCPAETWELYV